MLRPLGYLATAAALILYFSQPTLPSFDGTDWALVNYDARGSNFNPQDSISKKNIDRLGVRWVYTLDSEAGVMAPPLIVDGIIYLVTNDPAVIAIDGVKGEKIWEYRPVLDAGDQPLAEVGPHIHAMNHFAGRLLVGMPDCSIRIVDARTGEEERVLRNLCSGVPGNAGLYAPSNPAPLLLRGGEFVVWGVMAAGGTAAGRGFVASYTIDGDLKWRWFVVPPAGGDPEWDYKYVVERDGKMVSGPSRGNVKPYIGDWGSLGYDGLRTRSGGGPSFGNIAVDSDGEVIYLATSNPKPDWNATYRPGPNLYTNSIVALKVDTGDMLWFFQTTTHDLFNFDCGWNTVLAEIDGGEVVYKACKNGYLYALNAKDGRPLWIFNPPSLKRLNTENTELEKPWANYPSIAPYTQCPGAFGAIESDIAVAYGKVYVAVMNLCTKHIIKPVDDFSTESKGSIYFYNPSDSNTTIYAVNATTGEPVWSFTINAPYRGWLTATGGMVVASSLDGNIYFLDADNGTLLRRFNIGSPLRTGITVGSDRMGNYMLLQLVERVDEVTLGRSSSQMLVALWIEPDEGNASVATLVMALLVAALAGYVGLRLYRAFSLRGVISNRSSNRPSSQGVQHHEQR